MGFRNPISSLAADQITPGTLPAGVLLPAGQVSAGILDLLVIARALAAGTVTPAEIAAGAVIAGKIAANAVTGAEIAANAVTATEIAAGAVIAGKIAANAVTGAEIAANAVTATEIAAGAVIAGKIAANAVTAATIAADAITGKTITGGTVTGAILQTAAAGNRVDIRHDTGGSVKFYAGIASETPARIIATTGSYIPGDQLLTVAAGFSPGTEPAIGAPSLSMYCYEPGVGSWRGRLGLWADEVFCRGQRIDPPDPAGTVLTERITTNQAIAAATFTSVMWNARTETAAMNPTTNSGTRLVALAPGLHAFDTTVIFQNAGAGAGESRAVRFLVSRAGVITYHRGYSGPANVAANFTEVNAHLDIRLAAGDFVTVEAWATIALAVMANQGTRASMKWSSR